MRTVHVPIAALLGAGAILGPTVTTAAFAAHSAADYPNKPIRILVGQSPGGATDLVARALAHKLSESLAQTIVVDNRSGAAGSMKPVGSTCSKKRRMNSGASRHMRIRHYGLLANRAKREKLAQAREALDYQSAPQPPEPESVEAFWLRVASLDIHRCPYCKAGRMIPIGTIATNLLNRARPL